MYRFEISRRFKYFDRIWCRLSRSVPVVGLLAGFMFRRERLAERDLEDGKFESLVLYSEAKVSVSRYSVLKEKAIINGERFGHLAAIVIGGMIYLIVPYFRIVFTATWVIAFVADWIGGKIAGNQFDRKAADRLPD